MAQSHRRPWRGAGLFLMVFLAVSLAGCRLGGRGSPALPALPGKPATAVPASSQVIHSPVELAVLPEAGAQPFLQAIDGAQSSIRLKVYLVTDDDVLEALKRAKQRGVDVRVLIEPEPEGGGDSNQAAMAELAAAGVQVRERPGAFRYSHEKSLVVDDRRATIMTHNLTNSSFGKNREVEVISDDPAVVGEVAQVFDADWDRREPDLGAALLVWSPDNSRERLTALIDGAQASLDLEQNSLTDDDLANRLVDAARRGVIVRLITPTPDSGDDHEHELLSRLAASGGQVRLLDDPYVHAKTILVDGKTAMVGSQNLTRNSLESNRELGIVFDDVGAVNRLAGTFLQDWNQAMAFDGPPPGATAPPPGVAVSWQDASQYANQTITVEGDIVDTHNASSIVFLNFSGNRDDFKLVVFQEDFNRFPQPPEDLYLNKRIRATGTVKLYQGAPEIVIDDPGQVQILGNAASRTAAPGAASGTPVPWQDAGQHLGQTITLEGQVVRSHDSGKVTFLNFAEQYEGTTSVVIFASDYGKWPQPPGQFYQGQTIRVTGKVKEYQGVPEIVVESPEQVEVVGQAAASPTVAVTAVSNGATAAATVAPAKKPTAAPSQAAPAIVPWEQAASYDGQQITVKGSVVDTYKSAKVIFLNFSPNRDDFKVVIFKSDWSKWPQSPDELFQGQAVRVTGKVELYQGAPEIVVNGPEQIQVISKQ